LPADPSPASKRSEIIDSFVTVSSSFFANASSRANFPSAPLPAFTCLHHLAGLSHGLVRIVVKRGILQEFPGCSFALVQFVRVTESLSTVALALL